MGQLTRGEWAIRRRARVPLMLLTIILPLALLPGFASPARSVAQDSEAPTTAVLNITYTEDGYGVPESVEPGWYIVTLKNSSEADVVADIVKLPSDHDVTELQQSVTTDNGGSTVPDWFETVTFAGGPWAKAGGTGQTLIQLTTGTWNVLEVGKPDSDVAVLTVDDGPTPTGFPKMDQRVDVAMSPGVLTMPAELPTANLIWRVTNNDTLTHAFALVLLPGDMSQEEMQTMLQTGKVPDDVKLDEAPTVGGIGLLSGGRTIWTVYDLNPGYYVALDYVPIKDGRTFAELGQFAMFIVK